MQPDLENLKGKIKNKRDLLDRLIAKLPGYEGYVEKSELYQADKLVRDLIADKINSLKGKLDSFSGELVKKDGNTELLSELDAIGKIIERVYNKCKFAEHGNTTKARIDVKDEDKNRLLEYDWRMISEVEELEKVFNMLGTEEIKDIPKTLRDKIQEFEKIFDDRKHIILEVI